MSRRAGGYFAWSYACATSLPDYKVPVVAFHATLSCETTGKIFKRRHRDPYWEKSGRRI